MPAAQQEENLVCNLSSHTFDQSEMQILQLGLGFVYTPVYNTFQTWVDIFKLIRNIKLKKMFGDSQTNADDNFRPKSQFVPNISDPHIQTFENVLLEDIKNLETRQHKPFFNLNRNQKETLKKLTSDPALIFKEADKGTDYMQELNRQLDMREYCCPIQSDLTSHIMNILCVVINEASSLNYINERMAAFWTNQFPKASVMYILPKTHKKGHPLPGKPIIFGFGGLLEPPAQFLEHFFKTICV